MMPDGSGLFLPMMALLFWTSPLEITKFQYGARPSVLSLYDVGELVPTYPRLVDISSRLRSNITIHSPQNSIRFWSMSSLMNPLSDVAFFPQS